MHTQNRTRRRSSQGARQTIVAILFLTASASSATAGERRFGYSYESTTLSRGQIEFENWATIEGGTRDDPSARSVSFRHELEFGLTDTAQLDVYLADWTWTDPLQGSDSSAQYEDSAVTLKFNYADPATEPVGFASYHEVKVGPEIVELENKLILETRSESAIWVYNLTLEAAWEGPGYAEDSGEIQNSFGVSWESSPRLFFGAEALHEIPLPDWETGGKSNLFAGPTVSYRFGGSADAWITTSALAELGGANDEPEYQLRVIFGFSL
jgi:hypothetical protein